MAIFSQLTKPAELLLELKYSTYGCYDWFVRSSNRRWYFITTKIYVFGKHYLYMVKTWI